LYFETVAPQIPRWRKRNKTYHRLLRKYYSFFVPQGLRVLEVGCGTGDLLASLKPEYGVGIDFSPKIIEIAKANHPGLHFFVRNAEKPGIEETFDYIILSDLVSSLWDIQVVLESLQNSCHHRTRIIISSHNYAWEPVLNLLESLKLKLRQPKQNWLSAKDISTVLSVAGFETIRTEKKILIPVYVPVLSWLFNRIIVNLPLLRNLGLVNFIVARPSGYRENDYSVSVIVPAKNEKGNIENTVRRIPVLSKQQEIIFVEGDSSDGTLEEMIRVRDAFSSKDIKVIRQTGKGKGNAVREGFGEASGDILIILDADLTTSPEELPKFYNALRTNKGELINGCRLVYPRERQSMLFLNLAANKLFSVLLSYLLGQRLKDTLCGTKALFRNDYLSLDRNRIIYGDLDPFGDFDLLFGATKLNLKIVEINVRYKERQYGSAQISRFRHGWILLKMILSASRRLKFF